MSTADRIQGKVPEKRLIVIIDTCRIGFAADSKVERAIRERQWDNAAQLIGIYARDYPKHFDAVQGSAWQRQIATGRDEDRKVSDIRRLEQVVTQAIQERRWGAADQAINQVAQLNANHSQLAAWRRSVSAGRAAGETGSVILQHGEYFDLETARKTTVRGAGNFMLLKSSALMFLIAVRDTSFSLMNETPYDRITVDDLRSLNYQTPVVRPPYLVRGAIIAVRTKTGMYAKLRIDQSAPALELTWTVYK